MILRLTLPKIVFQNWMGWLMLVLVSFPNLVLYFGISTSLALGTILEGCVVLFFYMYAPKRQSDLIFGRLSPGAFTALVAMSVLLHFFTASLIEPTDINRAVLSVVFLVLFIF